MTPETRLLKKLIALYLEVQAKRDGFERPADAIGKAAEEAHQALYEFVLAERSPGDEESRWQVVAGEAHCISAGDDLTLCGLETTVSPEVCEICRGMLAVRRKIPELAGADDEPESIQFVALAADGLVHVVRDAGGDPDAPWLECRDDHVADPRLLVRVEMEDGRAWVMNLDADLVEAPPCLECFRGRTS